MTKQTLIDAAKRQGLPTKEVITDKGTYVTITNGGIEYWYECLEEQAILHFPEGWLQSALKALEGDRQ